MEQLTKDKILEASKRLSTGKSSNPYMDQSSAEHIIRDYLSNSIYDLDNADREFVLGMLRCILNFNNRYKSLEEKHVKVTTRAYALKKKLTALKKK